ncbi:recombinase family protein [Metasolibacillus meyeri]|uniref:recombinase family protein n=1 Tax=Metasolibacillus meyeri TaxID=1071052 RepID=UPI000D31E260|nr:recombinase family protein [Metasolibacillus meyeri]
MTVGIYIRVSTEEQANEGYSISAQRERLKAFCSAQGWNEYKFYVDEGISGRNTKRPQLKRLLTDIKNGHVKTLLVYRLDRLTRSVRDLHKILDELEQYNCTFRSATEFYDTSTAMGKMFITIIAAIAEWESANLGERVTMGQLEKARQGEWLAQAPYGWYKDENDKLHIDHEKIGAIKLMIKKVREGISFRQLSMLMDASEYKPKRGYKWHIRTLLDLMHNPVLYGAMYFKGEVYEDVAEGVMTKEEYLQLQEIISSRQNFKKRNVTSHFIFQMKIVCPDCGSRCTSERYAWTRKTDGVTEVRNRYRCQVCVLNNTERIAFNVGEMTIEDALEQYMQNLVVEMSEDRESNNDNDELAKLKKELKQIENQREKYQRAWASDLITDDEFKERMDESRTRYEYVQNEVRYLQSATPHVYNPELYREIAQSFNQNYKALTQEERRQFIQTFVEKITIEILERNLYKGSRNQRIRISSVTFF